MQVAVGPIIVCVSYLEKPLISTLTVNYPGITCSGGGGGAAADPALDSKHHRLWVLMIALLRAKAFSSSTL